MYYDEVSKNIESLFLQQCLHSTPALYLPQWKFQEKLQHTIKLQLKIDPSPLGVKVDHGKMSVKTAEGLCFINRYKKNRYKKKTTIWAHSSTCLSVKRKSVLLLGSVLVSAFQMQDSMWFMLCPLCCCYWYVPSWLQFINANIRK